MREGDTPSREAVLEANRSLSARIAGSYNESEPHYRAENVARVREKVGAVVEATHAEALLDLGCGTGFIIDIARDLVSRIHGVDASEEMIGRIDRSSGKAEITAEVADTGEVDVERGAYDVVTAYSFLHHLYDVPATLNTAAHALRSGGQLYVDLEPNKAFWDAVGELDRDGSYDPIIAREIAMVADHQGVALEIGIEPDVFDLAEWGKTHGGGLGENQLATWLSEAGFVDVRFSYEWFVGQGQLINDRDLGRDLALEQADVIDAHLQRALPLSRHLFKYIGFVATRA